MVSSHENGLTVLFDSNFLMAAARLHFDVFHAVGRRLDSPFTGRILSSNLEELRGLTSRGNAIERREARVALKLAKSCETIHLPSGVADPDDSIVIQAKMSTNTIVATNDGALRARLRRIGRPVLFIRRSGALALSGFED